MLGGVRDQEGGQWSVLVLDAITTKVITKVAGISDIMDYGVSRASQGWGAGSHVPCSLTPTARVAQPAPCPTFCLGAATTRTDAK